MLWDYCFVRQKRAGRNAAANRNINFIKDDIWILEGKNDTTGLQANERVEVCCLAFPLICPVPLYLIGRCRFMRELFACYRRILDDQYQIYAKLCHPTREER